MKWRLLSRCIIEPSLLLLDVITLGVFTLNAHSNPDLTNAQTNANSDTGLAKFTRSEERK